jgi:integrase
MPGDNLPLGDAIAQYLAARTDLMPASVESYAYLLRQLQAAHPDLPLRAFEPPAGQALVRRYLDTGWGNGAAATYKKQLTGLRAFFRWQVEAGNLSEMPTDGLTSPPLIDRRKRRTISRAEVRKLLRANPEPREQVPLRLLLTAGLPKAALRHVRFGDLDAAAGTVAYKRRTVQSLPVPDDKFWVHLETLRGQRQPKDTDYLLPTQVTRRYNPKPHEFAAMERDGVIDSDGSYLFQRSDGSWWRSLLEPASQLSDHGTHDWWYARLWRAGLVPEGVKKGFPLQSTRYTFGRRRYTEAGSLKDLQRDLGGLTRAGTVSHVYKNQDADPLDSALRRTLLRVPTWSKEATPNAHGTDGDAAPRHWWKYPIRTFALYVEDERDLVELSRVSVELLRAGSSTSEDLHVAAETLTRAVTAADLVERARSESERDHPLLHGHSLVAIWSALEVMVSDVIETWLLWWAQARTLADAEVSVPRGQGQPADEWAAAIRLALERKYIQRVNRNPKSPRRLDQYEWMLAAVGLPADAHDQDARMATNLWEMQQIRNVYAHRRGIADARLVHSNRGLPFKVGEQVRIDRSAWADFLVTTVLYADMLTRRMKRALGLPERLHRMPAPAIRYPT